MSQLLLGAAWRPKVQAWAATEPNDAAHAANAQQQQQQQQQRRRRRHQLAAPAYADCQESLLATSVRPHCLWPFFLQKRSEGKTHGSKRAATYSSRFRSAPEAILASPAPLGSSGRLIELQAALGFLSVGRHWLTKGARAERNTRARRKAARGGRRGGQEPDRRVRWAHWLGIVRAWGRLGLFTRDHVLSAADFGARKPPATMLAKQTLRAGPVEEQKAESRRAKG